MKHIKKFNESRDTQNYMFFSNIENIHKMCQELLQMDKNQIDQILSEHNWATDHIATSKDDIEEVYNFLKTYKR